MNTYEPGTVAVATVRGVEGVRVMRVQTLDGWVDQFGYAHTAEGEGLRTLEPVTDIRPLVVLDLNDVAADNVIRTLRIHGTPCDLATADQIEAQTRPPRIPEPGLWGVVRAREVNATNEFDWLRTPSGNWACVLGSRVVAWDSLIDPTLVREGVAS